MITYDAFKQWHSELCPFDDGNSCLVDLYESDVYEGAYSAHPGHIPGAINIPAGLFVIDNQIINDGEALTQAIPNKDAQVVLYCGGPG